MGRQKIAINCSYYMPKGGGIKEYIFNLVKNLLLVKDDSIEFVYYVAKDFEGFWKDTMPSHLRYKVTPYASNQQIRRSLFQQKYWYSEEREENFDIFHSPFLYAPKFKKARVILTVHDLRFKVFPETYTFLRYVYLAYKVPKSIKVAEKIISISEFTKQEIVKHFKTDPAKIETVLEGVNLDTFRHESSIGSYIDEKFHLQKSKFILSVGHIEPRKNYVRLIEAFDKLIEESGLDLKLVIVGKKSFRSKDSIEAINKSRNVVYADFIDFKDLIWLYANCLYHVFPSYYEGFGFPSLEAAALGKCTVGSKVGSIPEITGKGGIYFDPFSIEDMTEKMQQMATDSNLITLTSKNAVENISRFSWKQNAEKTFSLYKTILKHA